MIRVANSLSVVIVVRSQYSARQASCGINLLPLARNRNVAEISNIPISVISYSTYLLTSLSTKTVPLLPLRHTWPYTTSLTPDKMRLTLSSITLLLSSASATILRIALPQAHAPALAHTSLSTSAFLHSSPPIRAPLSQWRGFNLDLSSAISNGTTSRAGSEESFLLDVVSKQYIFAPMLVSLDTKTGNVKGVWEVRRGEMWGEGGEGMRAVEVRDTDVDGVKEITARVTGARDFYEKRAGCKSTIPHPVRVIC